MTVTLALDVGGTKTTIGLVDTTCKRILKRETVPTTVGLIEFPQFIGSLVKSWVKIARDERIGVDPIVGVALPGNFEMGGRVMLKKGSAEQLIQKNETFYDLDITEWLTQDFPDDFSIFAVNDGIAQAVGGVYSTWCDDYANQVMLYMGPGTGLGGAIVEIGDDREDVRLVTDGHIFDVMVSIQGQECMAEDVLSGRGIFNRTGKVAKILNERDDYWNQHQAAIDDCVECAVQIVMNIKQKTIRKKFKENDWPQADIEFASTIEYVLLGGSIGTKGRLGQALYDRLSSEFDGLVVQPTDTDGNALIGAVLMGDK